MEPDIVASVQQLPAHVDVVAGGRIYWVKAAYLQETLAPKRHVAARHVLGPLVVQEHVDRSPGRTRHEFPLRLFEAHVASLGEPETIPSEQSHWEPTGDLRCCVRGPIVYH